MKNCEFCKSPMEDAPRLAKYGKFAGEYFIGCTNWRSKKTKHSIINLGKNKNPIGDAAKATKVTPPKNTKIENTSEVKLIKQSVLWVDRTMEDRKGWVIRYLKTMGCAKSWNENITQNTTNLFSTCWLASTELDSYEPVDDFTKRVTGMLQKILFRGTPTFIPKTSEDIYKEKIDVKEYNSLKKIPNLPNIVKENIDKNILFDSEEEKVFFNKLPTEVLRYTIPQAPLDQLITGLGVDTNGSRRVDFLINIPESQPVVIEIDGIQHRDSQMIDEERDQALNQVKVKVIRVPSNEINSFELKLDDNHINDIKWNKGLTDFILAPIEAHRLMIAILEAIRLGYLAGDKWGISLESCSKQSLFLITGYLKLLDAIDSLWGKDLAPRVAIFKNSDGNTYQWIRGSNNLTKTAEELKTPDIQIKLETFSSPIETLNNSNKPTIVIRSANLPVTPLEKTLEPSTRTVAQNDENSIQQSLLVILNEIFDKKEFREGQIEAITQVVKGKDCVVLLPTGAGKSLIYQVAGLILPGRSLVVDPLVALMEDQVRRLKEEGIDKLSDISGFTTQTGSTESALANLERGESYFTFISPERLQNKNFRQSLKKLSFATPINLVVLDEAHCISEWGHDFRTAYLNIGKVIRQTCLDTNNQAPPILALTGTASRAVLKDVIQELEINDLDEGTIIKPKSFDRPELHYKILKTKPGDELTNLIGSVKNLPKVVGIPDVQFFSSRGSRTSSGLVFTPHVNGEFGAQVIANELSKSLGISVPFYSGSAPKGFDERSWGIVKRDNAKQFIGNLAPILVTTKSFGMGIDKSNIRYVVHYGIPGSIESYYQEVGRAGRDRKDSYCILIFSELDGDKNRNRLDLDVDLEKIRLTPENSRSNRDDIDRQLFFHNNSFQGIENEVNSVLEIVDQIDNFKERKFIEMSMTNKEIQEKAIHRLVILGVIEDYTMDWGSKKIEILVRKITPIEILNSVVNYVENAQPGRGQSIKDSLEIDSDTKILTAIEECSRALIIMIYDVIEKARRRSLREMWLAARDCVNETQIRKRILDYLSEGELAPRLEALLEEKTFDFYSWIQEIEQMNSAEAGEWRGTTARLLASYPDHPGLLMSRAMAELIDQNGSKDEAHSSFEKSFSNALKLYKSNNQQVNQAGTQLVNILRKRTNRDGISVVSSALNLATGLSDLPWLYEDSQTNLNSAIVLLDIYISKTTEQVKELVNQIEGM